jgi:hypothetical protein
LGFFEAEFHRISLRELDEITNWSTADAKPKVVTQNSLAYRTNTEQNGAAHQQQKEQSPETVIFGALRDLTHHARASGK